MKLERTKRFYVSLAFGCPRRQLDAQRIYSFFIANGFVFSPNIKKADWLVLVTCAYIQKSEDVSTYWVEYLSMHKSKNARLVVAGCLPKINPDRLEKIGNFERLSPQELDKLDDLVGAKIKFSAISDAYECPDFPLYPVPIPTLGTAGKKFFSEFEFSFKFLKRCVAWLQKKFGIFESVKTQDHVDFKYTCEARSHYPDFEYDPKEIFTIRVAFGCAGRCSYCAIKFATGTIKSHPVAEIVRDFKSGLKRGYKKFILIGGDTGAYGVDIHTTIVELLDEIFKIEGDYKLVLKEFNAQWFVKYYDELERIFLVNHHRIDFVILPIQSGSDRILSQMYRPYKIDDVKDRLRRIKAKIPQMVWTTHIMVGFPGETEEDFEKSRQLLEEFKFSYVDIYSYEDRPHTAASEIGNKIPPDTIAKRIRILQEICDASYQESLGKPRKPLASN